MSKSPAAQTVTIAIPVTLQITVSVPNGAPANAKAAAESVAVYAAEHFAHVSHAQINAFNEVNRVHPQAIGTVDAVVSTIALPRRAAA